MSNKQNKFLRKEARKEVIKNKSAFEKLAIVNVAKGVKKMSFIEKLKFIKSILF